MRIGDEERVVGMIIIDNDEKEVLAISKNGYGKRTKLEDYRHQTRGGKGVLTLKATERIGELVAIKAVCSDDDLMIITHAGIMIRMSADGIRTLGRNTQGVKLINLNDGDEIADVTPLAIEDEDESELLDQEEVTEEAADEVPDEEGKGDDADNES
jgi:DNA gyrase subunit A